MEWMMTGFLMKFTQDGELLWYRFYTPPQAEGNSAGLEYTRVYGVTQTSDGGYIMAGEYFSSAGNVFPEGIQTAIAIKVDEFGCLEPGCQIGDDIPEQELSLLGLQVFPNPAAAYFTIEYALKSPFEHGTIVIYNNQGKVLFKKNVFMQADQVIIPSEDFPNGIYSVRLIVDNYTVTSSNVTISK
jgi:hypothetical protein